MTDAIQSRTRGKLVFEDDIFCFLDHMCTCHRTGEACILRILKIFNASFYTVNRLAVCVICFMLKTQLSYRQSAEH